MGFKTACRLNALKGLPLVFYLLLTYSTYLTCFSVDFKKNSFHDFPISKLLGLSRVDISLWQRTSESDAPRI